MFLLCSPHYISLNQIHIKSWVPYMFLSNLHYHGRVKPSNHHSTPLDRRLMPWTPSKISIIDAKYCEISIFPAFFQHFPSICMPNRGDLPNGHGGGARSIPPGVHPQVLKRLELALRHSEAFGGVAMSGCSTLWGATDDLVGGDWNMDRNIEFHRIWGWWSNLTFIFLEWDETTNQVICDIWCS